MAYIVTRNQRFYVVAYDGIDTLTGRERRRWHPAGPSRADAEAIAATLGAAPSPPADPSTQALTVGRFLSEQWMPRRRRQLRATTAHRYEWMIDNYINPRIGDAQLRCLRVEHVDRLYHDLLTGGSRTGGEGHAHPGFTMATYQHLVPGMSATAAIDFANMIATDGDEAPELASEA